MLNSEILLLVTLILLLCLSASVNCKLGCCILGLLDSVSSYVSLFGRWNGKIMPFYRGIAQSQNVSVHSTVEQSMALCSDSRWTPHIQLGQVGSLRRFKLSTNPICSASRWLLQQHRRDTSSLICPVSSLYVKKLGRHMGYSTDSWVKQSTVELICSAGNSTFGCPDPGWGRAGVCLPGKSFTHNLSLNRIFR